MWETGDFKKPKGEAGKFSEKLWGRTAAGYLGSIVNLSEAQWDAILTGADRWARGVAYDSDDEDAEAAERDEDCDIITTGGRATLEDSDEDGEPEDGEDVEMEEGTGNSVEQVEVS